MSENISSTSGAIVWLNGEVVDPGRASLRWDDHGLTVGDGVFETIKTVGAIRSLEPHLDRLQQSAAGLGMAPCPSRTQVSAAVHEVARRWAELAGGSAVGRVRVTATTGPGPAGSDRGSADPTLLITASPMSLSREPTAVITVHGPATSAERCRA
ncbi:MAG: aminotransferase class IV [Microthrixaceae bacterium]